jgi:ABC-type branched-subunit amino acid transport system substrate-binding protein
MRQKNKIFNCAVSAVLGFSLIGCGGGGGSTAPVDQPRVAFSVTLTDGPIRNAEVYLASLKGGQLSDTAAVTDADGKATISVLRSAITNLDNDDVPYFWARSTTSSTVVTYGGSARPLGSGAVTFKSYLPTASELKTIMQTSALSNDDKVKGSSVVSHFSQAKAMMIEKRAGFTASVALGGVANITGEKLSELALLKENLDSKLTDASSDATKKLIYMATLTKALVEDGLTQVFTGGKTVDDGFDNLLLEAVESTSTFSTTMANSLDSLKLEVARDLSASVFGDVFSQASLVALTSVTAALNLTATINQPAGIHPVPSTPKFYLVFPYTGQSASISRGYEQGVRSALKELESTGAIEVLTMESEVADSELRLAFFGEDTAGNTRSGSLYNRADVVAVASFRSGQTNLMANHPAKKDLLTLTSGTSTIFEKGYEQLVRFAASNSAQADAIMHILREKALAENRNIPFITLVETRGSLNEYELDLYSGVLKNQTLVESGLLDTGVSSPSTGITTKVTYPQLLGTFFVNEAGPVPTAAISSLVASQATTPYVVYAGLTGGFISAVKAFNTSGIDVARWYTSDGVYVDEINQSLTTAGVTELPPVSVMSLGITTSGTNYSNFVSAFQAKYTTSVTPSIFAQYGYDMGLFMKKVVNGINIDNDKLTRSVVKTRAMTTSLQAADGAVTGKKGSTVPNLEISNYDEFNLTAGGWVRIGPADFGELSN